MIAAYPEQPEEADNDVREDGTACHWLASEVWEGREPAVGSLSPNQRVIDDDMYEAVDLYMHHLNNRPEFTWQIEQPVDCSIIYPGMSGTPDAWAYKPGWLRVADLKYGFRYVDAWDNLQLIIYAIAILKLLGITDPECVVEMSIVQPRSYAKDGPVRTVHRRARELWAMLPELQDKARRAMSHIPSERPCVPNPGCIDCAARFACKALQQSALAGVEMSYGSVPLELPPGAAGTELRLLKLAAARMEARISGLEGQVEGIIASGKIVPGWSLETRVGRERWQEGMDANVLTLGRLFRKDLAKPQVPVSPAQARKQGVPESLVAQYAVKPTTGRKLTYQGRNTAAKAFSTPPNEVSK